MEKRVQCNRFTQKYPQNLKRRPTKEKVGQYLIIYISPLNNLDLNGMGPFIGRFFFNKYCQPFVSNSTSHEWKRVFFASPTADAQLQVGLQGSYNVFKKEDMSTHDFNM